MSPPFRLGLAGAGRMGSTHLRALETSSSVRVVAVAEPFAESRARLEGRGLRLHGDLASLLSAGDLDGVLVATPSDQHLETVTHLLQAGIPTLCEKPCGINSGQARAAARVAAERGVPLQVAYWRRYVPSLRDLHRRLRAGELGEIYFAASYQWDERPPAAAFRLRSGGIFVDMGVHEFDQLRWLTGQEFMEISSVAGAASSDEPVPGDVESAQALARMSGGAAALVSLGRRFASGDLCRVEVYATRGAEDCRFQEGLSGESVFLEALRLQAEDFAARVRGAEADGASATDAAAALEAAERATQGLAG